MEATGTYRWLYKLLSPHGTVLLAHPLRLYAMVQRRTKTDRLGAQLLANLLRVDQIPLAYIPSDEFQMLRDLTRYRTTLSRQLAQTKLHLRLLLARQNMNAPYTVPFGPRALYWFSRHAPNNIMCWIHHGGETRSRGMWDTNHTAALCVGVAHRWLIAFVIWYSDQSKGWPVKDALDP